MMTLLRKHRNWLMIVIAILALPFCLYFVKTDYSAIRNEKCATVYGRDITIVEAQRGARLCNLARQLGMQDLVNSLAVGANSENEMYVQFTLNLLVLRHEAGRLGIQPGSAEITDFVRTLRAFLGPTGFDPKKFDEFTQTILPAMGFTEAQIEELAKDELSLRRIKDLITTGVTVPETQSKLEYQQLYGKLSGSVVRLRAADLAKDLKINDEDIQKYYEAHKTELKTEEKRKVEFVNLTLTEAQKKLAGKERIDALQKLADRANDFSQALLEKGAEFHQVASKFQFLVTATGEFTISAPDPVMKADPQLAAAAFQLTTQEPTSDALQAPDGFYVLHLVTVVPARPLTLEEAKSKIVDALKESRSKEIVATRGAQISHDLREALLAKTPLPAALEKAKVKAEKFEPFSLSEDTDPEEMPKDTSKRPSDFIALRGAVANMEEGEVSDFAPWEDGGIVVVLEKRELPDAAKFAAKRATFEQRILSNKREVVFYEWLREREHDAGLATEKKRG